MKRSLLLIMTALACISLGCKRAYQRDVVKETYIHKYGVPVAKEDWTRNGKDGQIAQLLSNGVLVTKSYENGVLHGKTTYSFPNSSTIKLAETYDQGTLISKVENYPSGVPKEEVKYEKGEVNLLTYWYEDGTPAGLEIHTGDTILSGEYRTPLNVVEARVEEGIGARILRNGEGVLVSKDTIQNGQLVERVDYFPNGDPASITSFENGEIHGTKLTFLPGGLPNTVEQWVLGKQEGVTLVYLNGEKVAEIPYLHGQKHGIEFRYKDGTSVVEEVSWKHGIQHGPRKLIAGETSQIDWYHQGELVGRAAFERLNPPTR